jgi:hypothetical protein
MKKLMLLMIGGAFVATSAVAQDVQPHQKRNSQLNKKLLTGIKK